MTVVAASEKTLDAKTLESDKVTYKPWVRNPCWLTLPTVSDTENKVVGLMKITRESNLVAILAQVTTATQYTVDWGDGTVENINSGTQASHQYDWSDADISDTTRGAVTFIDSTNTVNKTAHGYTNGMEISFAEITTTTGITATQTYYVVNATADTFQVAATEGGSAIELTNDGSGYILPYKQVIVTVTPTTSGYFNLVTFRSRHPSLAASSDSGWLDIKCSVPQGSFNLSSSSPVMWHYSLEQFDGINIGALNDFSNFFTNCYNLRSIPNFNTRQDSTINASNMFNGCRSLTNIKLTNPRLGACDSMFTGCISLEEVELGKTSDVTSFSGMFNLCYNLKNVKLGGFPASTSNISFSSMFASCYSLKRAPYLDTRSATSVQSMFEKCWSLEYVHDLNLSKCTTLTNMFASCYKLTKAPNLKLPTTGSVSTSSMFSNCWNLRKGPIMDTSRVTNMASMFIQCYSLEEVPLYNTNLVTNMSAMFQQCYRLKTVPLFNTGSVTTMAQMFISCFSLQEVPLFNTQSCTSMASMFQNCYALTKVPLFNTASCTSMVSMFTACNSLQEVPLFNTNAVISFNSTFSNCFSLKEIPALNLNPVTSSTNLSGIFSGASAITKISATGARFTHSIASLKLSAAALNEYYTNLPTVTGQTLTVTGNWGVATDDPTIATAKGWTITG